MATLPGVPLYSAYGFDVREQVVEAATNGVRVRFPRMGRALNGPTPRQRYGCTARRDFINASISVISRGTVLMRSRPLLEMM